MSTLVADFIEQSKLELATLEANNWDLAVPVMQALVALVDFETLVPQRINGEQQSALNGAVANLTLSMIDPVTAKVEPLTTEQQQALINVGYNGTPQSTTENADVDDLTDFIDAIDVDDIISDIDVDALTDELNDLLDDI
jgi:hypothetical protein